MADLNINHIQFPPISSQEPPTPFGVLDDMQAAEGLVDDALLADRPIPPVIFGAGGPMYVHVVAKHGFYPSDAAHSG